MLRSMFVVKPHLVEERGVIPLVLRGVVWVDRVRDIRAD